MNPPAPWPGFHHVATTLIPPLTSWPRADTPPAAVAAWLDRLDLEGMKHALDLLLADRQVDPTRCALYGTPPGTVVPIPGTHLGVVRRTPDEFPWYVIVDPYHGRAYLYGRG